jgi:SOS-response transcriptional repressor LexA
MNVFEGPDIRGLVPLISWIQAGTWHEAEDLYEPGDAELHLPCPTSHGIHTYALRVEGDSMTSPHGKSYPDGCIIFVDPDQRGGVVSGGRVIAKLNGDNAVTFKVYIEDAGRRFLKPLNTQYPPIIEEFRILGKVIGKWEPE